MTAPGHGLQRILQVIVCVAVGSIFLVWYTSQTVAVATRFIHHVKTNDLIAQYKASHSGDAAVEVIVPEGPEGPLQILVVGDSITQGNEGDFTWRYRLHQWLQSQNVSYDFVGPYVGAHQPPEAEAPAHPQLYGEKEKPEEGANTNGTYAAKFASHHFAMGGYSASSVKGMIADVVTDHRPHIMLILLGFYDLRIFETMPNVVFHDILSIVTNARRSQPNMNIVVGTLPQAAKIWQPDSDDLVDRINRFNSLLRVHAAGWTTAESVVAVADVQALYECGPRYETDCPAGFDGLHPNERGDFQIAEAFSRALVADMDVGETPILHYDIPDRKLPIPSNITLESSPYGVTASWNRVYGAYGYEINVNKSSEPDKSPILDTNSNRWDSDSRFARDGQIFYARVRSKAGSSRVGKWSEWYTAVAHPRAPLPPLNMTTYATDGGIDISWDAPSSDVPVIEYNVRYQNCDKVETAAFNGTSAHIGQLKHGAKYTISIEPWSSAGAGLSTASQEVVVGYREPGVVKNIVARSKTAVVAHLTWDEAEGAAAYMVYRRNFDEDEVEWTGVDANPVKGNCFTSGTVFPGTAVYEWSVAAVNGAVEGEKSTPVIASQVDEAAKIVDCPKPSSTCIPQQEVDRLAACLRAHRC